VSYWGSIFLIGVLFFVESIQPHLFAAFYKTMHYVMSSASIYFYTPCFIVICLVPDIAADVIQAQIWPKKWQVIRERELDRNAPQYANEPTSPLVPLQDDKDISLEQSATAENLQLSDSHSDGSLN